MVEADISPSEAHAKTTQGGKTSESGGRKSERAQYDSAQLQATRAVLALALTLGYAVPTARDAGPGLAGTSPADKFDLDTARLTPQPRAGSIRT